MRPFNDYAVVIFDCDGVLIDSNNLKVEAMRQSLTGLGFSQAEADACADHFKQNFGISRYVHVEHFTAKLLTVNEADVERVKQDILAAFSEQCLSLYETAAIAESVTDLLTLCTAPKYIASGSDQTELRQVIQNRGLDHYFVEVFGSPRKKSDLIADILAREDNQNAVMIGDAKSDMLAAEANNIDFIFYSPLTNVECLMRDLCAINEHRIVDSFQELIDDY